MEHVDIELEVDAEKLTAIRAKYDGLDDCLVEMLMAWLVSTNPHPTWSILADALNAKAINAVALAEEGTRLPIEWRVNFCVIISFSIVKKRQPHHCQISYKVNQLLKV